MDNIDVKSEPRTICELFSSPKCKFLIPDYQRPYSWGIEQCTVLWSDIANFTLNADFNPDAPGYFLGTMVTFLNDDLQDEVIDGQQRIISLQLLMRAIYDRLDDSAQIKNEIGKCIWLTTDIGELDKATIKIQSDVLQDFDKTELANILLTGQANILSQSNYAANYSFFLDEVSNVVPNSLKYLAARLLNNCYVIKIRANSQDTALQIFTSINDKGCPLTTEHIFKSVLYKHILASEGIAAKDAFLERWATLAKRCDSVFDLQAKTKVTPFEFAFQIYALKFDWRTNNGKTLRKIYSPNDYALLKKPRVLDDISAMLDFLQDLCELNHMRFSDTTLRLAHILLRLKNAFATQSLVVYFLKKHGEDYSIDDADFASYLDKLIAFLLGQALLGNRVTHFTNFDFMRRIYPLVIVPDKVNDSLTAPKIIIEANMRSFKRGELARQLILNWWFFRNKNQELVDLDIKFQVEHIFPKYRAREEPMHDSNNIELLGNLALLEQKNNVHASDFRFPDKKKAYLGFYDAKGNFRKGTANRELQQLATAKNDFTEADIIERNEQILTAVLDTLDQHNFLIK